jgi:replicative DNA helicase
MEDQILEFNNHFLNQIIYHSIQNDHFLKAIRNVVDLNTFKTKDRKHIMQIIYNFYDDYKEAPKENFFDIFKEHEDTITNDLYDRCMNLIGILKDITGSNSEYILTKINDAMYHFQLEEASIEFAGLIKAKEYDRATGVILEAIKRPRQIEEPYYNYVSDRKFINDRLKDNRYKMKTKIEGLDNLIGGLRSKWLITTLGATKAGKTWFLIEMSVAAMLQGLNVLFVSLEMGKEQIDERLDMSVGFMTSSPSGEAEILRSMGDGYIKSLEVIQSIYNIQTVIKNRQRIKRISGGNLEIVAFDRGRLNWIDINRILDELEEKKGFFADVVIVDYLGIMKETESGQSKKDRISENCLGLKEIAATRNLIVISAMQGNRRAMTSKIFHSYLVADDIDTIFNSDLVMAICQTELEEKESKARVYIANYRHGKQHGSIGIYRDLSIGQFAIDEYEVKEDWGSSSDDDKADIEW